MRFSDAHDGYLWVTQGKTGAKVAIPLSLRLDAIGWTVGDIIAKCRDGSLSKYLLHHGRPHGSAKRGAPLFSTTISGRFSEARDAVGVKVAGKTPPTFHELRSLSLRLYHDQGINAQALAGHKSENMTSVYRDVRGDEWVKVS